MFLVLVAHRNNETAYCALLLLLILLLVLLVLSHCICLNLLRKASEEGRTTSSVPLEREVFAPSKSRLSLGYNGSVEVCNFVAFVMVRFHCLPLLLQFKRTVLIQEFLFGKKEVCPFISFIISYMFLLMCMKISNCFFLIFIISVNKSPEVGDFYVCSRQVIIYLV